MKKSLLFVIIIMSFLNANAQEPSDTLVSIAKMNWADADDFSHWANIEGDDRLEIVEEGLAIKNPHMQDKMWTHNVTVLANFSLEEGHNYIVRLTIKVPSDGTYYIDMCSWDKGDIGTSYQVPVTASNHFQIIDVEYPEYKYNVYGNGNIFLGYGWVVGTTILKEVEIFEKTNFSGIQSVKTAKRNNDVIYNLAGQKVDTSYKGIVIHNGRLVVK